MTFNSNLAGLPTHLLSLWPELIPYGMLLVGLLQFIVTVVLAFVVSTDAAKRQSTAAGLFLIGPWLWFFVVFLTGGYLGAFGYWLIHYSALRAPKNGGDRKIEREVSPVFPNV